MKAKKELSREMNGDIETVKFHVIEIDDINQEELDNLLECYSDLDGEDLYWAGIYQDINGDFYSIDIDKLLDDLKTRTKYSTDDNDEEIEILISKGNETIINKLEKYRGYDIYL